MELKRPQTQTQVAILSFTCFSLFILTVGLDDQVQAVLPPPTTKASGGERYVQMRAGAAFKIAVFADLHFGENAWSDWGPDHDVNSVKVMNTVLDNETPTDFVVYLGDVITANNFLIANASLYWDQAISPTKSRNIPWASVFGNHDDAPFEWPMEWFSAPGIPPLICPAVNSTYSGEEACSFRGTQRIELMKHDIEHDVLSYSSNGPKDLWPSISNYVLQVSSSDDPKSPVVYLYFLDSGGGSYPGVISNAQAEWFQKKSEEINPNSSVPELIFWHIPSQAYKNVAPQFEIHQPCVGSINIENVSSQAAELGIMDHLVKRPSVKNPSTAAEDARLASLISLDGILKQIKDIMRQSSVSTLSKSKKKALLASLDELMERMPSLLDIDHPCAQRQIADARRAIEAIPEEDDHFQETSHAHRASADLGSGSEVDVAQWNVLQFNTGSTTPFIIKCGANSNSELVIKADARVQEHKGGEIVRVVPRPSVLENMSLEEIKQVFSQLPEALSLLSLARTADGTRARYSRLYRTLAMKVPSLRDLVGELEKGGVLKDVRS